MWFPNPKGVISGDQFWQFFCIFFKKNECVESVGSQVVFSALVRGSRDRLTLHPLQPAQSNHSFSCPVSPWKMRRFLEAFWSHLGTFFIVFGVLFQSLIYSEKWKGRRERGWVGLAAIK